METFYDITSRDLDIWDTELDPLHADALKLSSDADMPDWFLERDVKIPQVILHDKLISDALIGTLPIKTEHSYSLNSDGDSMPESPRSLHAKIEDMDEECYPAMSMSTVTSTSRRTMDPSSASPSLSQSNSSHSSSSTSQISTSSSNSNLSSSSHHRQSQKMQLDLQQQHSSMSDNASTTSSCDEIDIDDTCIKDEPMSPTSSCPSSPVSPAYGINLNMANVAAFANADLVFEHKNGSLQLSPASQSLLKNQQIILSGSTSLQPQRIVMPKLNIKMEQSIPTANIFSLPPTPPSSLPSDESEGNQSPDRHIASPMSPPSIQAQQSSPVTSTTSSHRRSHLSTTPSSISATSTTSSSTQHISSSGGRVGYSGSSTRQPIHTPLISSQPKGSTGTLVLTEEEKRTLLAEGYPIPTRLPLTKAEEKSLKKIRRKIKNKISAQESRRKKKEYMDQLERKVELLVSENSDYRKRVESLEDSNANLMNQLTKLQALLNRQASKKM